MQKLLSCLLSATLICTSVIPSLAQVGPRQTAQGLRALTKASAGLPAKTPGVVNEAALLQSMRMAVLPLPHAALLSQTSRLPVSRQIVTYANASKRALLLRSDFPVLVLNRQAAAPEMRQAVEFYRGQLAKVDFANIPAAAALTDAQAKEVAATVADIASLGVTGLPSKDAALILDVYEKSVGTAAEPFVTAAAARALLRLGAYDALETLSTKSTVQPELWDGIASYAQTNKLPVKVASVQRRTVEVKQMQNSLQDFGLLNTIVVNPSATSTYLYMSAGKGPMAAAAPKAAAVAQAPKAAPAQQPATRLPYTTPNMTVVAHSAPTVLAAAPQEELHAFRDQGLATEGMEATFPVYWEDKSTGITLDVTFQFEDQAAKEAFYNRVDLEPDEFFVFDRGTGGIVIRKEMTAEQKANGAKAKDRGFYKVFFEGGQKTPFSLYKVLFSREMAPAFTSASTKIPEDVMKLLSTYRADLKQILSKELQAKYPALETYLAAKNTVLDKATIELLETGEIMQISKDIAAELNGILATHAGTPIKVFKDDIGHTAQNIAGLAEGTLSTMGQAITSALGLLGIERGSLANLPTSVGQYGPGAGPFIGGLAERFGAKKMLGVGQFLGMTGHSIAAISLALGASGVLTPMQTFGGMISGILVNGVAGTFHKQLNPMIAKQRASDPVSSSTTITDLNSWASVGGMYCYLFLPAATLATRLVTGSWQDSLWAVSAMFAGAATFPLAANLLLRKSRIQNIVKADAGNKDVSGLNKALDVTKSVWKSMKSTVKLGFSSPFLRKMFFATAGGHFMGLGFNSGPGHFIKENIANPSLAMAVSFASIYLTVFAGRKLGAKAMKHGFIGDRALAGLSGIIGVSMGAASLLPGLDFVTRCGLFAAAGLGFSNWVNVLQSIELSRPENVGKEAAVSSIYMLARLSGALTFLMGMYGDQLGAMLSLSPSTAALYALTMPLAAGTASMLLNHQYITKDLWPTAKRWGISAKNWFKTKLGLDKGASTDNQEPMQEAPAQ